jgi:DNA topoisomerase I
MSARGAAQAARDESTTADEQHGAAVAAAAAAHAGGLRYVNDDDPGIRRVAVRGGFSYRAPDGRRVTDEATLQRIRGLAIPPAWTDVWICAAPNGHIQATGRDARGRKQYRYHPLWREVRDRAKFERTIAFGEALPRLRRRVERDLRRPKLDRQRVIATVVRLLDTTLLRVGNEEYAQQNRSFGLTTLRDRHARVRGETLRFSFVGKSGKRHVVGLRDRRLARLVRRCQELPGQRLFQFVAADGTRHAIDSDDVNEYIRDAAGGEFSARDFRTWAGTMLCFRSLRGLRATAEDVPTSAAARKRQVNEAVAEVARWLGNTPAVCRSAYIHPAVIEDHLESDGTPPPGSRRMVIQMGGDSPTLELRPPPRRELGADERAVLERLRAMRRARARRARAAA